MADKMAETLPADQREQFKKLMTTQVDIAALSKAMIDAMVKNFTTEELKALARFLRLARRKIGDAKIWCLHGRHNAGGAG